MWNVFEQPWTLLVTAAVLLLLVACIRPFINEKYKRRLWLIPILVAVMGPTLDLAVYTDREKIQKVISTTVKAIENEDCNAIAAIISPNYKDSIHPNKKALVNKCRLYLQPHAVDKIIDSILDMNISGKSANVVMLNRILFDEKGDYAELRVLFIKAQIELEKGLDGNWLVSQTEILAVNNQPSQWEKVTYPNW